jgi:hypothetical protein
MHSAYPDQRALAGEHVVYLTPLHRQAVVQTEQLQIGADLCPKDTASPLQRATEGLETDADAMTAGLTRSGAASAPGGAAARGG